jgi:hypothetical protein
MRDVVIVPCYERPEFTRVCLKYLAQADRIQDKEVWLCQDNHEDGFKVDPQNAPADAREIALYFGRLFGSRAVYRSIAPHTTYGNSSNLIHSLQAAYDSGAERIYLVEDDIAVAPDFFSWHDAVLEEPHVFVSCATALSKSAHFQINGPQAMDETYQNPSAYYLAEGPYSSLAAAFKRVKLGGLLDYITAGSQKWESGFEQDLLTQRYLRILGANSAWPYMPRAYNFGWYSYHITGQPFTGSLQEKSRAVEEVIKNPTKLRSVSSNNSAVTALPDRWPARLELVQNVQRLR